VVVVLDDPGREALAEEVPPALVASVVRLRVRAVQALEPVGEPPELGLDDQVVVVRHQAEGVDAPVVALDLAREEREEEAVVVAVAKGGRAGDAPGGDVVDAFRRKLAARVPHASTLAPALAPAVSESGRPWSDRHTLVTPAMAERAHRQGQSLAETAKSAGAAEAITCVGERGAVPDRRRD
jgi:hypothetical protein